METLNTNGIRDAGCRYVLMATLLPKIVLPPTAQIEDHVSAEPTPEVHVSESANLIDVSGSSSDGKSKS